MRTPGALRSAMAVLVGVGVATAAPGARADTALGGAHLSGSAEAGYRFVTGDWGSAKWNEYRDYDPSFFGTTRLLLESADWRDYLALDSDYVGGNDQRYGIEWGRWGRGHLRLVYEEYPHFFSNDARSLLRLEHDDTYLLPAGLQAQLEPLTGAARSSALEQALATAPETSLDFLYRTGRADARYRLTDEVSARVGYFVQDRTGSRPLALGFGSPGGTFVNFAAPIDDRTHDVSAGVDWTSGPYSASLDLGGSWYSDHLRSLTVANPLRATDDPSAGSSNGRISTAPDNAALQVGLTGSWNVPVGFPMRATGTVSYGRRTQDDDFVDHTINSAISSALLALPVDSLDGVVNTYLASLLVTARPVDRVGLKLRYRWYDFDNDTARNTFPAEVVNDQSLTVGNTRTVFPEYRRQNLDLDASLQILSPLVAHVGYGWDRWDRSNDREVRNLDESEFRTALDWTVGDCCLLRTSYKFSVRSGSEYRTYATLARQVDSTVFDSEAAVSQSPFLRKYDEADRDRHEVDLLWQVTPIEELEIALTGGYARDYYHDARFGRDHDQGWNAGVELSWRPWERLGLRAGYGVESLYVQQFSRNRGVSGGMAVDDPLSDWESHWRSLIQDVNGGLDLVIVKDLVDLSVDYRFERADDRTLASGFFSATTMEEQARDYPEDRSELQILTTTLSFHATENLTLKAAWSWQRLDYRNFATEHLDPFMPISNWSSTAATPGDSSDVFLGDRRGSYNAQVIGLSAEIQF